VRLGDTRGRALRRARSAPASTTAYAYRWCVKGSARRVVAVFAGRAEGDRMVLAATSAAAHAKRGVAPGATRARLLRAFPRARRVASGVYAGGPTSRHVFGVRSGRVAFVAVAERALLDEPARLRRALRRAGL
jgi:hypothetical protein